MFKHIRFLIEGLKSPRKIGAVAPSSKMLAAEMIKDINFSSAKCIIEYGPGTGVFTEKLIKNKRPETILLVIEQNRSFYKELLKRYKEIDNLILINGSAENVEKYLHELKIQQADYVVSGLPFASLPKTASDLILQKTRKILKNDGKFITFQYTLLKKSYISTYFTQIDLDRVFFNLPPAFVFKCRNH
ncbi:rRNA adenine N-6-methyltransferase family protein [Eubacteriaceae bacterium ES3]|nr:rRNA adenine N-6-methyltransferase family protein [Eubacteriaceae bacterium ES3]